MGTNIITIFIILIVIVDLPFFILSGFDFETLKRLLILTISMIICLIGLDVHIKIIDAESVQQQIEDITSENEDIEAFIDGFFVNVIPEEELEDYLSLGSSIEYFELNIKKYISNMELYTKYNTYKKNLEKIEQLKEQINE